MPLDFSTFSDVRLDEGFERYRSDESDAQIRNGLIQRFEFTYHLAHKMLRRALEAGAANPEEIDRLTFPDLIRTGVEQGAGRRAMARVAHIPRDAQHHLAHV
jgi:hypothetical protein